MNFGVDTLVTWIVHENGGESNLVKDGKHNNWRIGKKVGKNRFR